jgi:hypothetical protein
MRFAASIPREFSATVRRALVGPAEVGGVTRWDLLHIPSNETEPALREMRFLLLRNLRDTFSFA